MATETAIASKPGRVKRFLAGFLMVIGGFALLIFVTMVITIAALLRGDRAMPSQVILELDLEDGLVENIPGDPVGAILYRNELTLRDAVDALKRAETDDRVTGMVARISGSVLGLAQIEELRAAVASFRASGKPAVIFSETFGEGGPGQGSYYLASAFDEIALQPSGDVGLAGLRMETPFLAGTLDKIGVEPRMDQRYEYKNALNQLTQTAMTPAHREASARLLESIYENLVSGIAEGRQLTIDQARALVENGPYMAQEALDAKLVDRLAYRDEAYDSLKARVGGEFLYAQNYLEAAGRPHDSGPTIALIVGSGTIMRGESGENPLAGGTAMGSESISQAFRQAIEDDDVRAILFRVDSPGGSYVASDAIWREVARARAAGKPVVVSMGDYAASGGYFVSAGADRIIAQPSTLTGSIGVYGGKILIDGISEKLGVTWDDVRTGGNTTMWSDVDDYSSAEWSRLQASLDRVYEDFTSKVAAGRNLSRDSTLTIARGRVWTGTDALGLGLVDELGGYETAIRATKEEAEIAEDSEVTIQVFPRERSLIETLFQSPESSSYPAGIRSLMNLSSVAGVILTELQKTGILGGGGALTMPPMEITH